MTELKDLYIEQLTKSVLNALNIDLAPSLISPNSPEELMRPEWFQHFWFGNALTMCSGKRLDNIRFCIEECLKNDVPGDIIECGAWRGGATILMRGILAAHGVDDRTVWVADSFQGLPRPAEGSVDEFMYNMEPVIQLQRFAVDLDVVKGHFARYGLLDDQVKFLPGWFEDTLPDAPIDKLAVLRLDGDFYESTAATLDNLYPKVSPGGYVIVDDWGIEQACGEKAAVVAYRDAHGITDEIIPIDWHAAYWRKSA